MSPGTARSIVGPGRQGDPRSVAGSLHIPQEKKAAMKNLMIRLAAVGVVLWGPGAARAQEDEDELIANRDASNTIADARTDLALAEHSAGEKNFAEATTYVDSCIQKLEDLFAKDPKAPERFTGSGNTRVTGREMMERCKAGKKKLGGQAAASQKEDEQGARAYLADIAEKNYEDGMAFLARARTLAKSGKSLDADEQYTFADKRLKVIEEIYSDKLEKLPGLASFQVKAGKKKVAASALLAEVKATREALNAEEARIRGKAQAQMDAYGDAFTKMPGDRGRIAREMGTPTAWEGSTRIGTDKQLAAARSAAEWHYDVSSGCNVTYRFQGNTLKKTTYSPLGCHR